MTRVYICVHHEPQHIARHVHYLGVEDERVEERAPSITRESQWERFKGRSTLWIMAWKVGFKYACEWESERRDERCNYMLGGLWPSREYRPRISFKALIRPKRYHEISEGAHYSKACQFVVLGCEIWLCRGAAKTLSCCLQTHAPGVAYIKDTRVRFRLNAYLLLKFPSAAPTDFPISAISRAKSITMSQSDASHTEGISDIVSGLQNNFLGDFLSDGSRKIHLQPCSHSSYCFLFYHPRGDSRG